MHYVYSTEQYLYTVNSAIIAGAAGVPVGAARCRMSDSFMGCCVSLGGDIRHINANIEVYMS